MGLKLRLYPTGYPMRLTEDTALIAQWETLGTTHYTITFDANGGSGEMQDLEFSLDMNATTYSFELPYCYYEPPNGFSFRMWSVNGTGYFPRDIVELSGDSVITAIWVYIPPIVV